MSSICRICAAPAARSRPATEQPAQDRSAAPARARLRGMPHQRRTAPRTSPPPDRRTCGLARAAPAPTSSSPQARVPSRAVQRHRIDLDHMRERHRRHRRPQSRLAIARRRSSRRRRRSCKPPQIVEAKLRRRQPRKLARRLARSDSAAAHSQAPAAAPPASCSLIGLERAAKRSPARKRLLEIERPEHPAAPDRGW